MGILLTDEEIVNLYLKMYPSSPFELKDIHPMDRCIARHACHKVIESLTDRRYCETVELGNVPVITEENWEQLRHEAGID